MTTGQRIQQARKKAGLSQKQLGEKLGLSASMIGQWENDLRNPKFDTLRRIAAALNTPIHNLIPNERGDYVTIGEKIRQVRIGLGMTQEQLAEKCGVATTTIRQYESGRREPREGQIRRIAKALSIPEDSFFNLKWYNYSEEFIQLERSTHLFEGIVFSLEEIYGAAERKELQGNTGWSSSYLVIGKPPHTFVLYDSDIEVIAEATRASIPALVERMKDTRPESEIVQEVLSELNRIPQPQPPEVPRYRRQEPPGAPPAPAGDMDTPAAQDAPEGAEEGE